MTILSVTAAQEAALDAMDTEMDNAFVDGVATTPPIAGYDGYADLKAEYKTLTKDAFKIVFAAYLKAASSTPTYTTTTLASGWTTSLAPRVYIDLLGIVHCDGILNAPSSPGSNPVMFTLPAGYRPDRSIQTAGADVNTACAILINTNGTVQFLGTPSGGTSVGFNLTFKAA